MMSRIPYRRAAITALIALTCTGCGAKGDKQTQTAVAAKVNGSEITVGQVKSQLARLGNLTPDQTKVAGNQLVRALVDQELLVKKAEEAKLDRDPQVMGVLDNARRQILAEAYTDSLTKNLPAPTAAEVADYYDKHPELFANRKIFRLNELAIGATPDKFDEIKAQLAKSKTLQEFADWLKSQNIPFRGASGVKKAEELPLEMLPRLNAMTDGQTMVMTGTGNLVVMQLVASQAQPVTREQARTAIERFLVSQKRREALDAEVKKLRASAKIEYLGDFADAGKAAPSAPNPPPASAPAVPAGDPPGTAASGASGFIGKGLSGK